MNARTRRKLEMGARALEFCRAHPDPSPAYAAAAARLEERLARGIGLAVQQDQGSLRAHSAALRKRDLRGNMRRAHLADLIRVARIASRDLPEVRHTFELRRGTIPHLEFRMAARGMTAEARSRKDVLVQHGLSDTVLDKVADEVVEIVRVMDRLNRFRFATRPDLQAAWRSASSVVATSRTSSGMGSTEEPPHDPDDLPPAA